MIYNGARKYLRKKTKYLYVLCFLYFVMYRNALIVGKTSFVRVPNVYSFSPL